MSKYDENQIEDGEVVIDLGVLLSDMWRGFKKYWGWILIILVGLRGCLIPGHKAYL